MELLSDFLPFLGLIHVDNTDDRFLIIRNVFHHSSPFGARSMKTRQKALTIFAF